MNNSEDLNFPIEKENDEASKYHVPNLERALQMLELLAQHPAGLGITEISNLLNFPKNSTFRIAMTLLNFGYLNREEGMKSFTLSGKLLSLGYTAVSDQNLMEKSLDVMKELRDTVKETVLIGVVIQQKGVVLEQVPSLHSFKFWVDVGTQWNMHTAAPSKAILAFLPESEKIKICQSLEFKRFTSHTIANLNEFYKVLDDVKVKGYSTDSGEELEGMHCISAPIFDRNNYPVAAIWITGPMERLPLSVFRYWEDCKRICNENFFSFGILPTIVYRKKLEDKRLYKTLFRTKFYISVIFLH
jgi:DNA-binding IclR family transcriptional regulator